MNAEQERFEVEWRRRFDRFADRGGSEARISGWSEHGLARRLRAVQASLVRRPLPSAALVLDLGCGTGLYCHHLRQGGHRVLGADYSLGMLRRAREVTASAAAGEPVPLIAADILALPLAEQAFDGLINVGVLQHIARVEQAMTEMHRVLRPGGRALFVTLNRRSLHALLAWLVAWPRSWRRGQPRPQRHAIRRGPRQLSLLARAAGFSTLRARGVYLFPRGLRFLEPLFDRLDCPLTLPLANAMLLEAERPR